MNEHIYFFDPITGLSRCTYCGEPEKDFDEICEVRINEQREKVSLAAVGSRVSLPFLADRRTF